VHAASIVSPADVYTNCIVPLDGSDFARAAVPIAAAYAKTMGMQLQVIGIARNDGELAWMYDHVHASAGDASDVDVLVDPDPVETLLQLAAEPGGKKSKRKEKKY